MQTSATAGVIDWVAAYDALPYGTNAAVARRMRMSEPYTRLLLRRGDERAWRWAQRISEKIKRDKAAADAAARKSMEVAVNASR